jgi:membrane protease YdiL (CAAX protease family)
LPFPTIARTFAAVAAFVLGMVSGLVFTPFHDRLSAGVWIALVAVPGQLLGLAAALHLVGWPLRRLVRQCVVPRGTMLPLVAMAYGCFLLSLSGLWVLSRFLRLPDGPEGLAREIAGASGPIDAGLLFFVIAVQAPVVEEILLRGIALRGFVLNWGAGAGVVASALVFAVLHANATQFVVGLVTGVIFGWTALRTGTLGPSILMHTVINGTTVLGLFVFGAQSEGPQTVPGVTMTVLVAAAGFAMVMSGFERLPRDPARLAALWGLPPDAGTSIAELRRAARTVPAPTLAASTTIDGPASG